MISYGPKFFGVAPEDPEDGDPEGGGGVDPKELIAASPS
jgi:hypothetical protein